MEAKGGIVKNDIFEMANREIEADKLTSKAWRYCRNFANKKDGDANREKQIMLTTMASSNKRLNKIAIELADLAHSLHRIAEFAEGDMAADVAKLSNRAKQVLQTFDIEFVDPTGAIIDDTLADKIRVVDNYAKSGISGHRVGETLYTIVTLKGRLIRAGEVIGWYSEQKE